MNMTDQLQEIIKTLQEAVEDAEKCDKGQAGAPGTRLRKTAQGAKKKLDSLRKGVLDARG
jgi:hypothetical protein